MPEKKRRYSFEQAQKEAGIMSEKVFFKRARDYEEAEQQVDAAAEKQAAREFEDTKKVILAQLRRIPWMPENYQCGTFYHPTENDIKEIVDLKLPEIEEAKKEKARELLDKGDMYSFSKLENRFGSLPADFMDSEEFRPHVRNGLISKLEKEMRDYTGHSGTHHNIKEAEELVEKFNIGKNEIKLPEVQEALKIALLNKIKDNQPRIGQETIDFFNISDELIESPEVQLAIKEQLISLLTSNRSKSHIVPMNQLDKSKEVQNDPEVNEALKNWMVSFIKKGSHFFKNEFSEMKSEFRQFDSLLNTPEVKQAIKSRLVVELTNGAHGHHKTLTEVVEIPSDILSDEEVQDALKQGMINRFVLSYGAERAKVIKDDFDISNIIDEPEVQASIKQGILETLKGERHFKFENIVVIKDEFGISDEIIDDSEVQQAVDEKFASQLSKGELDSVEAIAEIFNIPIPLELDDVTRVIFETNSGGVIAAHLENRIFQIYKEKIVEQVGSDYYSKYAEEIKTVFSDNQDLTLTKEDIDLIETGDSKLNRISYSELNSLKQNNSLEVYSLADDESAEKVYLELRSQEAHEWRDNVICGHFEEGSKVFGYSRMFEFAKPGSRHDALYAFDRIVEMCQKSGLNEKQFYNNILSQTAKDEGEQVIAEDGDEWGATQTSYQRLNDITASFRFDFDKVFQETDKFKIEQLQKLVSEIEDPKNIFSSWKILQKYHELTKMLERTELLSDLENEPSEKLKNYVATLAFHPTIENMQAVMDFWRNPERFLESDSSHTTHEVHDSKKPSNYTDIPNLDLSPEDMRNVLVEGGLDKIQAWESMEVEYLVPRDTGKYQELENQEFSQMLLEALGKRGETEGKTNQPEKIAKLVADIMEIPLSHLSKVISGDIKPTDEQKKSVIDLIFFDKRGYNEKSERYLAKINSKSDPDGVVAGNDTKTCDPFGDGKNVLYTYNPVCASFTLQKETQRGKFTTIGQSILTKDKDVGVNINKLRQKFEEGNLSLAEEIPEKILREAKSIIAADSVEVNANFKQDKYSQIISDLYKDFFAEYLRRYAERDNLDTSKVVTGSCSYELADLGSEENTYVPESPVAYSDKYKDQVHVIDFSKRRERYFKKEVTVPEKTATKEEASIDEKNVQYLTYQDTLPTAYLEGKVYSDTSLQQGLHEMENTLIAKDINNSHKDRPNMSLKYVDDKGEMRGYMVAYEGKIGANRHQETQHDGEKCVYVMDIAKNPDDKKAGFGLMNGFMELYKKNYIDNDNPLPIFAEAREATSFKILTRQLERFGRKVGKKFEMEELGTWESGEEKDTRHIVIIRCLEE